MSWGSKDFSKSLENRVLRALRARPIAKPTLVVACSGGLDSMVLAEILYRWRNLLKKRLLIAHIHHGPGGGTYRNRALKFTQSWADAHSLEYFTNPRSKKKLTSEAELRDFRWKWLNDLAAKENAIVVTAHHSDDLLETRMLRLIRGTGVQGSQAMVSGHKILRPLLAESKNDLEKYAELNAISFIEDPTNLEDKFLRNWLRQWLNKLEKKQPGGLRNLSLGLDQLVMKALERPSQIETVLTDGAINRRLFLQLDRDQRRQIAAHYFRHRGLKNYTQGHVEELLKRLDDRRREYTFEMLKCCWSVTSDSVKATDLRKPTKRASLK